MRAWIVHLIDGTEIHVPPCDEDDVVLAAGERAGQDIAHLVTEVEPL